MLGYALLSILNTKEGKAKDMLSINSLNQRVRYFIIYGIRLLPLQDASISLFYVSLYECAQEVTHYRCSRAVLGLEVHTRFP